MKKVVSRTLGSTRGRRRKVTRRQGKLKRGSTTFLGSGSVEEILIPSSFKDVLKEKSLRTKFREFLNKRVAVECLNFYEAIELYEQVTIESARQKAGKHILEEYLEENARFWVNIPGELRVSLLLLEHFQADSFIAAKQAIEDLMSVNFYEEFKKKLRNGNAKCNAPTLSFENKHVYRSSSFEDISQQFSSDILSLRSKLDVEDDESVPQHPPPKEAFAKNGKGRLKRNSENNRRGKLSRKPSSTFGNSSLGNLFKRKQKKKSSVQSNQKKSSVVEKRRLSHLDTDVWKEVENEHEIDFNFDF